MDMIDNIFGTNIEPETRQARHRASHSGVRHLMRREPLDPLPGQPITLHLTTGGTVPYDAAVCRYTTDGSDPNSPTATVLELEPGPAEWDDPGWGFVRGWTVDLPPQPAQTLLRYRLSARRADTGAWEAADPSTEAENNGLTNALWVDDDPPPAWAREALVYHIFLDRFNPGAGRAWQQPSSLSGFFGGALRGVTEKLDYIQSLGFDTLWLSPFFKSNSHHGYNASDYYTVEPRLGTNDELKELVHQAHQRGLRLVLDFVANHWSKEHPTFQEAQRDPASPYRDWYTWKHWPDDYGMYFHVKELPRVNLDHPPARVYMIEAARHWLREGFDGFRLDHANGPSPDKQVNPDCWIFAEIIHTPEKLRRYAGIFDGTLDFILARALRETFALERMSLAEFENTLQSQDAFFPPDFMRPAFLDNHDMSRFLYLCGNNKEKLKLAALLIYTLPGTPIVYNGAEAGVSQERPMQQGSRYIFEEARLPMRWDTGADAALMDFFRRLAGLRRAHPALVHGRRRLLHLDASTRTYAYLRDDGNERLVTAVNAGAAACSLSLSGTGLRSAVDLLNGRPVEARDEALLIHLPPHGCALLG